MSVSAASLCLPLPRTDLLLLTPPCPFIFISLELGAVARYMVLWCMVHARLNSESWPRAGNPGHDLCKTDFIETSILAPRLVCLIH
jgi:hypothetical protein